MHVCTVIMYVCRRQGMWVDVYVCTHIGSDIFYEMWYLSFTVEADDVPVTRYLTDPRLCSSEIHLMVILQHECVSNSACVGVK
jgi:hypothetical protein